MKVDGLVLLADGECRRLADLGVDGMAVDLFYRGMVGVAADYERCPIARAIAAVLGLEEGTVLASRFGVSYKSGLFPGVVEHGLCAFKGGLLPIREFVEAFDGGEFPFLHGEDK